MKSVALIGFSDMTFGFCKDSKADELWTVNHAAIVKDMPKFHRLFEIHKKDWYLRKEAPRSAIYEKWLEEQHDFPIYMQRKRKEVPNSVRYPLEEIVAELLPGLVWVDAEGKEIVRSKYFTSSASYMMALAIYEKFDVIEIYGIDMENNTEYGYQKPCMEFWEGYALGRGIKIIQRELCPLCYAPLYGYEEVPYVDAAKLREVLIFYQDNRDEIKKRMDDLAVKIGLEPGNEELQDQYMKESAMYYAYHGAVEAGNKLIMESDTYISRQFIEMKRASYYNGMDYWKGMTNVKKSAYEQKDERGEATPEDWTEYLSARASMYANMGIFQLFTKLMALIDFRPVRYELHQEIVD